MSFYVSPWGAQSAYSRTFPEATCAQIPPFHAHLINSPLPFGFGIDKPDVRLRPVEVCNVESGGGPGPLCPNLCPIQCVRMLSTWVLKLQDVAQKGSNSNNLHTFTPHAPSFGGRGSRVQIPAPRLCNVLKRWRFHRSRHSSLWDSRFIALMEEVFGR